MNSVVASSSEVAAGRFLRVLRGDVSSVPPIWMMRQAGRYHRPYQALRAKHSFETLCREPDLAAEVTLGPVLDFDFDAAILFSDLLFPLEALGFGLSYDDGPPKLDGVLDADRVARFRPLEAALERLEFQHHAMKATRTRLAPDKALIGFVGGPWTLFVYAMEGTHAGALARSKAAPDLYRAFADRMVPLLIENIRLQFAGGADVVMLFDTAAGELSPEAFIRQTVPDLAAMAAAFPGRLGYYAKGVVPAHFGGAGGLSTGPAFDRIPFTGLGVDWHWDLAAALKAPRPTRFLQGNFDPAALKLPRAEFEAALGQFLAPLVTLDAESRRGWICGLGHGVLPATPEENVRSFVQTVRKAFA